MKLRRVAAAQVKVNRSVGQVGDVASHLPALPSANHDTRGTRDSKDAETTGVLREKFLFNFFSLCAIVRCCRTGAALVVSSRGVIELERGTPASFTIGPRTNAQGICSLVRVCAVIIYVPQPRPSPPLFLIPSFHYYKRVRAV